LGNIDFPLLGKTNIEGMSSQEVAENLKQGLKKYFLDPYVYVTFSGKVYILNGRGGYTVPISNERLTIFEALATPGSYEPDDKWGEVLVIREDGNTRSTAFLDLNSKDILNSPYYFLRNKDVLYIKPSKINATLRSTIAIRNTLGLITGFLALVFFIKK
jgi:polysaccharide export outer membrane protein